MPTSTTINATGGTITTSTANGWIIKTHTFTSSGSFVVTGAGASDVIEYIVVGGGGGGTFNNYIGSGGGGAEVKYANSVVTNSTYTITVGAGGTAKSMSGYGGGGAGGSSNIAGSITLGALGGPGSGMNGNPDATGTYTYGTSTAYYGAGAGGAGGAGVAGNGGAGKLINTGIFSSSPTYYGGGGAGGLASASGLTSLTGGVGGGANTTLSGGQPATPNSGGGGAGGSQMQSTPASDGAAGVVKISYYTTTAVGVFSNVSTVTSGGSIQFTLYSANTGNIPYTISGVTSAQISNASLTGNFVMSGGSGSFTVVTSSSASMGPVYTLSLSSDGYTSNVNITPNVTILTSTMLESTYSTMLVPLPGQLNIPHVGANAITDPSLQTKQKIVLSNSMMANKVVVPVTTSTTTNPTGPLTTYVIKPLGSDPNREFWM